MAGVKKNLLQLQTCPFIGSKQKVIGIANWRSINISCEEKIKKTLRTKNGRTGFFPSRKKTADKQKATPIPAKKKQFFNVLPKYIESWKKHSIIKNKNAKKYK